MTSKELRRLSRAELLELLIIERREIERLNEECRRLKSELNLRKAAPNEHKEIRK